MLALTHYADMGLPTSVAIVTEGNTETTAEVAWDTTSPASGSYNPAVLTEQSVTLNGTVTCPSNIDQNGVTLTTTIPVTGTAGKRISTTIKAIAVKSGMQNSSVTSATYVIELPAPAPSTYAVTVNNGTGDGSYAAGATVTITADTASSGHEFDKWTVVSGGVTLASATSATTTFEMPASAVEVTATYKNKASEPNPPAPTPTYTITAGAGGTHELSIDGTLSITCDGALDKLTGIYVDDKLVDAANYTLQSGSTILTFNASYLTICIIVMAIPNAC